MFRIRIFPTDYWTSTAIVIVTMLFSLCAAAQVRRAIEAQDCVTVRYLAVDNTRSTGHSNESTSDSCHLSGKESPYRDK